MVGKCGICMDMRSVSRAPQKGKNITELILACVRSVPSGFTLGFVPLSHSNIARSEEDGDRQGWVSSVRRRKRQRYRQSGVLSQNSYMAMELVHCPNYSTFLHTFNSGLCNNMPQTRKWFWLFSRVFNLSAILDINTVSHLLRRIERRSGVPLQKLCKVYVK